MNANAKNELVRLRIFERTGIRISESDASKLRRAATALQRWHELYCGNESGHVERDESDKPWFYGKGRWVYAGMNHQSYFNPPPCPIRDTEKSALRTVAEVCQRNGLTYHVQGDPRGCPLYIGAGPFPESVSPSTVGVSVEVR